MRSSELARSLGRRLFVDRVSPPETHNRISPQRLKNSTFFFASSFCAGDKSLYSQIPPLSYPMDPDSTAFHQSVENRAAFSDSEAGPKSSFREQRRRVNVLERDFDFAERAPLDAKHESPNSLDLHREPRAIETWLYRRRRRKDPPGGSAGGRLGSDRRCPGVFLGEQERLICTCWAPPSSCPRGRRA